MWLTSQLFKNGNIVNISLVFKCIGHVQSVSIVKRERGTVNERF